MSTLVFPDAPSRLTFELTVDQGLEPLVGRVHAALVPDFGRFRPARIDVATRTRCASYEEPRAPTPDDDALNLGAPVWAD